MLTLPRARCNSARVRLASFVPDVLVALASCMHRADPLGTPASSVHELGCRRPLNRWYAAEATGGDVSPLEVDAMLLCVMRAASSLIRSREIRRNIDEPAYAPLKDYMRLVRNQIMVDEATDFSPLQLACMGALSNSRIQSFFACGDFNQRITSWGTRSVDDLRWAFPRLDVRPIQVSSRAEEWVDNDVVAIGEVEEARPRASRSAWRSGGP